nr:hydrogen peroxide-inducible genes activator [Pseudaestuariivita atlantica]
MNLTLKQLRYVDALARHRHFGRAADACAVSQPALSMQIGALEDTLGQPLFERGPRAVLPTRLGETFAARAAAILRAVDDLGDLARASSEVPGGRMRLGVIPTIAPYLVPHLIPALARALPDLDLHIRETTTARLVEELKDGRIDTAILALPSGDPLLSETPLLSEHFVLVRPDNATGPSPTLDDLGSERLLLLEEGHCLRDQALSFCSTARGGARDGLDGSSLSTLVQMVGAGLGITLIPEMAIPIETRSAAVRISRFHGAQPGRDIGMVWRRTSPLEDHLHRIAGIVRTVAEGLRSD